MRIAFDAPAERGTQHEDVLEEVVQMVVERTRKKGVRTAASAKPHKHSHAEGNGEQKEEMCCDGSGRSAEEHRKESADGKCCVDE